MMHGVDAGVRVGLGGVDQTPLCGFHGSLDRGRNTPMAILFFIVKV